MVQKGVVFVKDYKFKTKIESYFKQYFYKVFFLILERTIFLTLMHISCYGSKSSLLIKGVLLKIMFCLGNLFYIVLKHCAE
jgi:hypothetical protein